MAAEASTRPKQAPSLTAQAASLLAAKIIGFAISLAAPLVVVRMLSQAEFGLYKQVTVLLATALQLPLAFYMTMFYFLPRKSAEEGSRVVLNVLLVHGVIGLTVMAVLLVYPPVLGRLANDELIRYAPLIGAAIALTLMSWVVETVAVAKQDIRYSTVFIVLAQFTKGVAMVTAALFGSVQALLYAIIFQAVVQLSVLAWYLRRRFPRPFLHRPDLTLLREQIAYSAPLAVSAVASVVRQSYHFFVVAAHFSAAEYAFYAVGCSSLPLVPLIQESLFSVMIPRTSYLQQQGHTREILVLFAAATRKLAFFHLPLFAILTVVAVEFISFLYGEKYAPSSSIFLINIVALLFLLPSDPINRAYESQRKLLMWVRMATTVFLVPAVYVGIRIAGMEGAIAAVILTMVIDEAIVAFTVCRVLGVTTRDLPLFADVGKIAVASAVASIGALVVRSSMAGMRPFFILVCASTVFGLTYLAMAILLRIPTPAEKAMVSDNVMRIRRVFARAA